MKNWFLNLSQRERLMVIAACSIVTIFVVYQLLIDPVIHSYERNKRSVDKAEETISWMKTAAVEVQQLKGSGLSVRPQGKQLVLGMIDKSIKKANLSAVMKRIQPEGNSGVRLWFENAEFNVLIQWLSQIEIEHGLVVNEINIDKTESPGLVNVRIYLES